MKWVCDSGSSRLTLCSSSSRSFVGNTEIDVDIKRYYCKAGIKSIQVRNVPIFDLLLHADKGTVFFAPLMVSAVAVRKEVWAWQMETFDGNEGERLGKSSRFQIWILFFLALRWSFFVPQQTFDVTQSAVPEPTGRPCDSKTENNIAGGTWSNFTILLPCKLRRLFRGSSFSVGATQLSERNKLYGTQMSRPKVI